MATDHDNPEVEPLADVLEAIAQQCAQLPLLDTRSSDEILDYDENGLPR